MRITLSHLAPWVFSLLGPIIAAEPGLAVEAAAGDASGFGRILSGTVIITSTDRSALFAEGPGKPVTSARLGEVVDGWRIEAIEPEQVTLARAGGPSSPSQSLTLRLTGGTVPPPARQPFTVSHEVDDHPPERRE